MNNKNIAILIPSTSKGRNWTTLQECDLYKFTLKSFLETYDKLHTYSFFIGIDNDDAFYAESVKDEFSKLINGVKGLSITFVPFPPDGGNVVKIWNGLFKIAYELNNDYFHQTGDDIVYMDSMWVNKCIAELKKMNDMGVVGHTDWGRKQQNPDDCLLTQSFVSRLHYQLLGYYFHPLIRNWFCDNYITELYNSVGLLRIIPHRISNVGGEPRYQIANASQLYKECVLKDLWKVDYFIEARKRIICI